VNQSHEILGFRFDNSYSRELEGFYVPWKAEQAKAPSLLHWNRDLAISLGWQADATSEDLAQIFGGNRELSGSHPIAQAYAGHQFGGFSPQLGDGRALLIGEVVTAQEERYDLAFKGSGPTPFSRGGDGKAAVGPVLREYLIGEFMHAMQIPTTRALAAVATGDTVYRNGPLPGAVLTRVASSHIRVGTFEFFAARRQLDKLKQLADYTIRRHAPEVLESQDPYLELLAHVSKSQASLIAKWLSIGFIHGVMNTDNMAISGETIDYGPCAFMEAYRPGTVFSSIDTQGRYAYDQQASIVLWNLTRFAECLLPLIHDSQQDAATGAVTEILGQFAGQFETQWRLEFGRKLGLSKPEPADEGLIKAWLDLLAKNLADYTLAWRSLADVWEELPSDLTCMLSTEEDGKLWLQRWKSRLKREGRQPQQISKTLREINPNYIPRNHLVEKALTAATLQNDLKPFENLLAAISNPCSEREEFESLKEPAEAEFTASYRTFCGT
jgi:uncharacterized protein YdiU (UPF0061 family)